MAKIRLTEGFTLIPEGTYTFRVIAACYKEDFGKLEVTMQTQGGSKHIERFSLLRANGSPNEGALNAFSYFAKTALNDFSLTEINHTDLVGCFIECDIEHDVQPNQKKPGQTITFARLADKRPADGWDEVAPTAPAPTVTKTSGKPSIDLKALLG